MKSVTEILSEKKRAIFGVGVSEDAVLEAEKKLNVKFADSYKKYLVTYGVVAYSGHELTGLSKSDRTDVVKVTVMEKEINNLVPDELYVIEQTNVEGIVIWQNESGEIFRTDMVSEPRKVYNSFEDFLLR